MYIIIKEEKKRTKNTEKINGTKEALRIKRNGKSQDKKNVKGLSFSTDDILNLSSIALPCPVFVPCQFQTGMKADGAEAEEEETSQGDTVFHLI